MNIKKKLLNPFLLVVQGFVAGAAIFWLTMPAEEPAQQLSTPVQSAALAKNIDA